MQFSDYIVFADESGDHNLAASNAEYPVFVLSFCIFRKSDYVNVVCPAIQSFKHRWFGHDAVILHEREIRKDSPPFQFLKTPDIKREFQKELTDILMQSPLEIIAAVIDKPKLRARYFQPLNPYHLALFFCMERLAAYLSERNEAGRLTHVLFEQRGGKALGGVEDRTLELEFRRIMDGQHDLATKPIHGMEMKIVSKASNSIGLQIADLVARPIGLKVMRPDQPNRGFDVIQKKFLKLAGIPLLKVFP